MNCQHKILVVKNGPATVHAYTYAKSDSFSSSLCPSVPPSLTSSSPSSFLFYSPCPYSSSLYPLSVFLAVHLKVIASFHFLVTL